MRPMFEAAKKLYGDKPVIGVEVGVSAGKNAVEFLSEWKEIVKLYGIDSYPTYDDFNTQEAQTTMLFCAINSFIPEPRAHLIVENSVAASKRFEPESVDFVYIDANHIYECVKEDITAWLPKVRKGGIIGGHDLDWADKDGRYSVLDAVKEIFGNEKVNCHESIFTSDSRTTENGYYSGLNSDWWVFL